MCVWKWCDGVVSVAQLRPDVSEAAEGVGRPGCLIPCLGADILSIGGEESPEAFK